ncbi:MAG: prepilin-type N-terminal cleavage/methylation domain-containing protein [Herminiimonas sp.]|nr:prepilin-type N-terminal cleavage/methylation domain-containing protein [Herminiimonas sp.]
MASRHEPSGGFTLIELLVAISILAIVAVLGWRGLDSIVRARIALTADLEQTRGMQLTFAQLQSDCANIAPFSTIPNRAPLVAEEGRLLLVRNVYADSQPSRLQVVTYRVRDGKLTRHESPATRDLGEIDSAWISAASDATIAQAVVLQAGVDSIAMRLWSSDGSGWRNGVAGAAPLIPQAVRVAGALPTVITGLEVSLQVTGRSLPMQKVFLLGAV